mmetsp:Transcript_72868/g.122711  ORF Transcript_72868/g.122711 Transcript_72868/m.122711 type:complete len:243 (-) Transcript_72868:1029-1757(-)
MSPSARSTAACALTAASYSALTPAFGTIKPSDCALARSKLFSKNCSVSDTSGNRPSAPGPATVHRARRYGDFRSAARGAMRSQADHIARNPWTVLRKRATCFREATSTSTQHTCCTSRPPANTRDTSRSRSGSDFSPSMIPRRSGLCMRSSTASRRLLMSLTTRSGLQSHRLNSRLPKGVTQWFRCCSSVPAAVLSREFSSTSRLASVMPSRIRCEDRVSDGLYWWTCRIDSSSSSSFSLCR